MIAVVTTEGDELRLVTYRRDATGKLYQWTTVRGDDARVRAAVGAASQIDAVLTAAQSPAAPPRSLQCEGTKPERRAMGHLLDLRRAGELPQESQLPSRPGRP